MLQEQRQGRVRLLARNGGRERREAARKSPMLRLHSASESSSFRELKTDHEVLFPFPYTMEVAGL